MGRSGPSCLKIIACGSESVVDQDDLDVSQSKGSSEKRGWSFRKRSTPNRVLNNTIISVTPSFENKMISESDEINYLPPATSTVPEQIDIPALTDPKPQLSTEMKSKPSETTIVAESETINDIYVEEKYVIMVQAFVRGFLAQRALLKLKNLVKLQAAVRGHLIRNHAAGTLRCVQAIVKMQTLVRARRAHISSEGTDKEEILDGKDGSSLENGNTLTKLNMPTSMQKLLSNRFAQQLLESTPKTKTIHIKSDSSKPNSVWLWLERWMSVSSSDLAQTSKPELRTEECERVEDKISASQMSAEIFLEIVNEAADMTSKLEEAAMPSKTEEDLITDNADVLDTEACSISMSSLGDNLEHPQPEQIDLSDPKWTSPEITSLPNQSIQSDSESQMMVISLPIKPVMESQQSEHSVNRLASEQLENEGKQFVTGTRKASNPAFIAVQSKFEELSSATNSGISINPSQQVVGVDSNNSPVSPGADTVFRISDLNGSRPEVSGSECGTELSISSTLDSPDRAETEATEFVQEAKILEEGTCDDNSMKNSGVEAKSSSGVPVSNMSLSVSNQSQKLEKINDVSFKSKDVVDLQPVEQKTEESKYHPQVELDSETGYANRPSPETSPRTRVTLPESQATPASQVSVKTKNSKVDNSGSNKKRQLSAGRSPSNPSHDSGGRKSMEKLPNNKKGQKKNNLLSSPKPDHNDEERRDSSCSSNSVPRFMQATESARAKLNANSSSRSSPDVLERDIHVKKIHSLPGANGREGSSRIQRSTSQAQQSVKGNEKKWVR